MKKILCAITAVGLLGVSANAQNTVNYGWEDGGTILGSFGNVSISENVSVGLDIQGNTVTHHDGNRMLYLTEDPLSGTPQAYLALVTGINDGDVITASFYGWDFTPGANSSMRVWGHYITDANDIDSYLASAGGNNTYTDGNPAWSQVSQTWTVDLVSNPTAVGLVVEARLYSGSDPGLNEFWVDSLSVTAPDTASIITPVPEPSVIALLGLGGLAIAMRRRQ